MVVGKPLYPEHKKMGLRLAFLLRPVSSKSWARWKGGSSGRRNVIWKGVPTPLHLPAI
jgi:hypothetical protein